MRTKNFEIRSTLVAIAVLLIAVVLLLIISPSLRHFVNSPQTAKAQVTALGSLSGFAWSDNLGWICFNSSSYCSTAGVTVQSDGTLAGYAWTNPSDDIGGTNNVGWIDFNADDTSGCGFGPAQLTGTSFSGGALVTSADNNGWNGCIDLSGSGYGVTLNSTGSVQSGPLDGYAWADSTVGGWISFNCDTGGPTANNICGTSNYAVTYTTNTPPPPSIFISNFTSSTSRVRSGRAPTLLYTVTAPNGTTCTITGSDSSSYPVTADSTQHSVNANSITKNTLYTLTCGSVTATINVGVVPVVKEI